jgi:ribosomal protein L37AE/L43A
MNTEDVAPDPAAALVDGTGRPAARARAESKVCPRCRLGEDRRVASCGFGDAIPICSRCGHEFVGERWDG